jgi:hypothetical protein
MRRIALLLLGLVLIARGGLIVFGDQGGGRLGMSRGLAELCVLGGAAAVTLAGVAHVLVLLGAWAERRRRTRARHLAELPAGPCRLCGADGPRVPAYVEAEKRRWAAPRLSRTTTATIKLNCCPACYARFGGLGRVATLGQVAGVFLCFGLPLGVLTGGIGLVVVAGLFFGLQVWMNRRYTRLLTAPALAALKRKLGIKWWNPLADRINYGVRSVPSLEEEPYQQEDPASALERVN